MQGKGRHNNKGQTVVTWTMAVKKKKEVNEKSK